MSREFGWDGKVAIVTGANSGIGEAIALALAAEGALLCLVARDQARLERVRVEATRAGAEKVDVVVGDVSRPGVSEEIVRRAVKMSGGIDALVPCAGIFNNEPLTATSIGNFDAVTATNLRAPYELILHAVPHFNREASVLLVSSLLGHVGFPSSSAYGASKGGIEMLTRCLARELASQEVRINAIAPGIIKTAINRAAIDGDSEYAAWLVERIPLGYIGRPDQVASAALFLLSKAASYITGTTLHVDGGWVAE